MSNEFECPRSHERCDMCLDIGKEATKVALHHFKPGLSTEAQRTLIENSGLKARLVEDTGVAMLSCAERVQRAHDVGRDIGEHLAKGYTS